MMVFSYLLLQAPFLIQLIMAADVLTAQRTGPHMKHFPLAILFHKYAVLPVIQR